MYSRFETLSVKVVSIDLPHSTPFDVAWDIILGSPEGSANAKALSQLFPNNTGCLEERRLSLIHRIVLGLSQRDLKTELHLADVDKADARGMTPLMYAASRCDAKVVNRLLDANASTDLRDIGGKSALHHAARGGNIRCLKMLLTTAIDVNLRDGYGLTALHYVTRSKYHDRNAIDCMLAASADVNAPDLEGASPLQHCACYDDSYSAKALLNAGANIDTPDREGDTPLCEAFYRHTDDVIQLLLNHDATYTLNDSHGNSILHQAALYGGLRTLDILLNSDLAALDTEMLNREGKASRRLAEERVGKEAGFLEKMDQLLAQIQLQSKELMDIGQAGIRNRDILLERSEGATQEPSSGSHPLPTGWITSAGMKGRMGRYHLRIYVGVRLTHWC